MPQGLTPGNCRASSKDLGQNGHPAERGPMPQRFAASEERLRGSGAPQSRILAFGDSLTAGFFANGQRFAPYAAALVESLLPSAAADVWVCGLSGLKASELGSKLDAQEIRDVAGRQGKGLRRILAEQGPFDLAIIMAGTNDVGDASMSPESIVTSVRSLHAACHSVGVRTVALSVPPSYASVQSPKQDPLYQGRWQKVNQLLGEWARGPGKSEGCALFVDV